MKQRLLIALLLAAIFSCTKENPVPASASVPLPWRVSGLTPQTSTYTAVKQVDCNNVPPPAPKPFCGQSPKPKPVGGGCNKGGNGGGGGSDSCCRLAPPPPPPVTPER
jgi:hypothetical protein